MLKNFPEGIPTWGRNDNNIYISSLHVFHVTIDHATILSKGAFSLPIIPLLNMILKIFYNYFY